MFNEKFMDILNHEGAASVVACRDNVAHISNTWNSYIRVKEDKILIPAAGMTHIENDTKENNNIVLVIASKEVEGSIGMGAGFEVKGSAQFLVEGNNFSEMKESFPWLTRVLEITPEAIRQTL